MSEYHNSTSFIISNSIESDRGGNISKEEFSTEKDNGKRDGEIVKHRSSKEEIGSVEDEKDSIVQDE